MDALLHDDSFRLALVLAAIGALGAWGLARRRGRGSFAVALGAIGVVSALVALRAEYTTSWWLFLGVACVAVSAKSRRRLGWRSGRLGLRLVGALAVALALSASDGWVRLVVAVSIVLVTPLVSVADHRAARLTPLLLFGSALAVYSGVPDTETARVLVGAFAPVALVALLAGRASGASTAAGVVLVLYAAGLGGGQASGAVIAGMGAVGVLALVGMSGFHLRTVLDAVWLVAVHAGLVVWWSRVAGLRHDAGTALLLGLPAVAVAWIALASWSRLRRRPPDWGPVFGGSITRA